MNKKNQIFKYFLLSMVFLFLLVHIIYKQFNFINIPPLKGDILYSQQPQINDTTWFSGIFQKQQEAYINDTFGFRSIYVRLNNQIRFSLFHKTNVQQVIVGKENYLYEENYIKAYTGEDFLGPDSINKIANRIKFISDTLKKLNKQLIIIFAAGKASFYPEYIPDKYLTHLKNTNYKFLSESLKKKAVCCIDFNKWFIENKFKSKYLLYPKYANHWSIYGSVLAADSIIHYIENVRNINMPDLIYDTIDLKKPFGNDYDIANGMNLLFKFKSVDMAYPRIYTEDEKGKIKPAVLVVSDSFYWSMLYFGISKSFKDNRFWYYNKKVYPDPDNRELLVENHNLAKEISKNDVFIVMATEASLNKIGWGFLEKLEKHFR